MAVNLTESVFHFSDVLHHSTETLQNLVIIAKFQKVRSFSELRIAMSGFSM